MAGVILRRVSIIFVDREYPSSTQMIAVTQHATADRPSGLIGESAGSEVAHLRLTVVFTTPEGTLGALQAASSLAASLSARVMVLAIDVVPLQLPIDRPPVPLAFRESRLRRLVEESQLDAHEVSIAMCVARDRWECLQQFLPPASLVVIGGRKGWTSPERRLVRWLKRQGHQIVFVDRIHNE